MIRGAIAFSLLLAAMLAPASFTQEQQDGSPEPTITLRGTAVAPNGEAAGDLPIRVTRIVRHAIPPEATVAEGRTAADGTFEVEFAARGLAVVTVHFGDKYDTNWSVVSVRVEEVHASGPRRQLSEVDLETVKLRSRVERKPEQDGSSLCFAVSMLLVSGPVGLLLFRPRRRGEKIDPP